ncbi:GGDEF domain-containing protein [Dissulfurirhabdus thermomarina]|uniref:GGDEF domain-containing protein n=1 Tax=Dissulfurirhabdus thermomarina TaxID=1765737 RepID=A0A6N9TTH9_DISTH|nr:GGDEF domain-containing protein [Dissulfurirhabdus thermomarina]NDY41806.1 GGDEF domain-containing protein [Dissulfurirhabdus thermomarina]
MPETAARAELCPLGARCPVQDELTRLKEEHRRLTGLVQTDPLTGLFNLRHLMECLDRELERTRRTGLPTSLVMMDLDHFKAINDTHGHEAGNQALRWASGLWRKALRRLDVLCRYGGEEFVAILPATPLPRAVQTAERLRRALAETPMELDGRRVALTASFGVDVYLPRHTFSPEAFIKRTDAFLLAAKAAGRNRVHHRDLGAGTAPTALTPEERSALADGGDPGRRHRE